MRKQLFVLVILAPVVAAAAAAGNAPVRVGDVEVCVVLPRDRIPLGTPTGLELSIWNRGTTAAEYSIERLRVPERYTTGRITDYVPDTFSRLEPGGLLLRGWRLFSDLAFTPDMAGNYELPVRIRIKTGDQEKLVGKTVTYQLTGESPGDRYLVKPVMRYVIRDHNRGKVQAYRLDDTAWREACTQEHQRIFQGATQKNLEDWLDREKQWYDTPCGHDGFGKPDDWVGTGLIDQLETLLAGDYAIGTMSYRILYQVQYEARRKWGLSPYYAVRHAIWVMHEEGKEAAVKYLDGLDTSGWSCVDLAIRGWATSRIAAWTGQGKPEGLVYSEELKRSNQLVYDKKTGRLHLRKE